MTSRKKLNWTIWLTPEQMAALRAMHERTRIPMAVLVRQALDEFFARNAPPPTEARA